MGRVQIPNQNLDKNGRRCICNVRSKVDQRAGLPACFYAVHCQKWQGRLPKEESILQVLGKSEIS